MTKNVKNGRGRPSLIGNKKNLAKFLENGDFENVTNFMKQKLVNEGFLTVTKIQTGKRGRPQEVLTVSGKGKGLLAMSRNWGKKVAA